MAPSTDFLCPNLIDTPFEKGGEFSIWIFCVVALIASYKAFEFSKKTLQPGLGLANTEVNKLV